MSQNPFSDPGLGSDLLPATQQNKNPFLDPNLGKDSSGTASDLAKSVKVGVQRLPGVVAGLADLPVALATGARPFTAAADALGEATGFQPGKWADETQFSAAHEQSKKAVDAAWQDGSAADIAKAYIANPGYTANQVAEALPGMVAGGLAGRVLMGVGRVAAPAARAGGMGPGMPGLAERALGKWAAPVAGGVGEGAMTAGQQMAQYQGEDQQQNALASLGAGVGTGLIGVGAGRVANKLGLETAETAIAKAGTGAAKAADEVPLSLKRRVLGGMVSETLLQELPQSAQEQMWSNWAEGKPLMEGVARAGTEGAIAGGVMGAGANLRGGRAQQQADTQADAQTDTQTGQQTQETPQPVQRPSEAMGIDPSAGPLSKGAAMAVDSGTYMPPADLMQQAAPEEDPIVLQNRDRNSAASIAQMQEIAANPDYLRMGPSREMTSGAPIVFGDLPPTAVLGRQEMVVDGNGQRVGTQYAVVDAGDLIASNHADGSAVAEYAAGVRGKLRSVAGNGRTAGLQAAYDKGTAQGYRQELLADAASIGVDAQALAGMQRPVLVRVMGQGDVTADMGDRTNITGTQKLSPVEQAANDARRFDIANLAFDEGGNPTAKSIAGFVSSMPVSEQGDMMNPDGSPTRQAVDRLMAATFKQAYDSDELVQLYAQAADPDARAVLSAAADASGVMAALSGTEFDVRQAVADAVKMAVNASRQGLKLSDVLQNADFDMSTEAYPVASFLAQNIRSPKAMAEGLRRWGQLALQQVRVAEENKYQGNLLGDPTPTLSREEIFRRIGDAYNPTQQSVDARSAEAVQAQQLGMDAMPVEPGAPMAQALPGAAAQESRPRNWRTSMLGAVPVAKALGIEHKGKRLAQVVAEIDARDSERNQTLGQAQQAQAATENIAPDAGPFGPIFDGFENNPEGAIAKLMQEKRGEVPDAFTHHELGPIAFIYGDEGMGLRHIEAKRGIQWVRRIPAILRNGRLERDPKLPRAYLVQDGDPAGVAVIRLDWDGEQKTWLVTAHPDDKGKWSGVGKTSRTADNESGLVQGNPSQSIPQSDSATTSKAEQTITRADVAPAQQQGAQPTAREAQELGAKQRQEAKRQKQRTARQDSATETGLRVGVAPGNAETVTVRDGVVYLGAYEALNYDTGEPVTVAKGSTREQVAQALKEAGVLSSRQRLFGLGERSAEVMFSRKQMDGAQDGKPSNPEAERQFKETERAYGGRAAYDRAKAAGKTKLTYGQWVQVRTPNFKAWFGDWEVQSSNSVVNQQIEQWASGELPANVILNIGHPSSVLTQHGVPNMPITLRQAILRKAVKDKHGVAAAQLKDIAQAVQAPTAIFDDPDNPGTRIAVTEIRHTDGNIIAAIRLNTERDGLEINDIRSIHPKRDSSVLRWVEDGLLLGLDKEKGRDWLENLAATNPQQPQADFAALDSILYDAVTVRNASKVVDAETGEPLVVYHGTGRDFAEFKKEHQRPGQYGGEGFFFTGNPDAAALFGDAVMPVFLQAKTGLIEKRRARARGDVVHIDHIRPKDDGRDIWVVMEPTQIKSATGNNGNFDPANPDIRFSFAGQQAATADTMALATAQQRLNAGEDAETVRKETGWFKGNDGNWRFEINDADARLLKEPSDPNAYADIFDEAANRSNGVPLAEVLDHPALFAAYPKLQTVRLIVDDKAAYAGSYSAEENAIRVRGPYSYDGGQEELLSILLHEVQHGIQHIEGFATGGAQDFAAALIGEARAQKDELRQKRNIAWNRLSEEAERLVRNQPGSDFVRNAIKKFRSQLGEKSDTNPYGVTDTQAVLFELAETDLIYPRLAKRLFSIEQLASISDPRTAYLRLAGEVEARNTQARQKMTDEERRATPPRTTQDVGDDFQVVVTFNGKLAASAPTPANAASFDFQAMRAAVLGSGVGSMSAEEARAILALRRPARATKESVHAALRQLVGGLGLLPNRLGRVVVATAAEIKQDWEPLIGPTGMEASDAGEAQGFYDPKSRTVFLIADHINAGDELGVVAHELMHKHGQAVLGEEGWSKLHGAIEGWARAQPGSMERRVYEEAMERVQASRPDGVNAARYSSQELFPYAVQVALEMGVQPNLLAKPGTVARWLGQVRAALRQVWDKITRKPEQFKTQDLVNLAFGIAQRENPQHAGELDGMTGQRGVDTGESPMFSRAAPTPKPKPGAAGWAAPSASWFDDTVYILQDKHVDTKRVLESIRATGKAIADGEDVYLQEELYHGRVAKRAEDFANNELQPLMAYMSSVGLKISDVEEYLHARHAKEANAVIAQRNPKLPDGGSGMTNAEADAVLASFNGIRRAQLARAAAQVDAIISGTRQTFVDYGLESQDTVDGWAQTFAHYVPLMREQDGDGMAGLGTGQGFSIKGREVKGRTGSTRKVVDILANIVRQRELAIERGEKNRVAIALVGLAKSNPSDFWTVDVVPTRQTLDKKTGMATTQHDPLYKQRDNVVVAKIPVLDKKTGKVVVKEHAVVFNEDSARAVRMATAFKNLDAPQMEGLLGATAQVTRYLAAINTQYNPIFGLTNLARDVQGAALNLASTPLAGKQRQVLGQTLSALAGIYADQRARTKGKGSTASPWAQLWQEFQSVGGQTGYRDQFRTSADRGQALAQALDPSSWTETKWGQFFTVGGRLKVPMEVARKAMAPVFAWLDDYNTAMENGVRLSAYKVALDAGMSKERAASLAKNLTTNFSRKGQSATQVGALYAFFNASVQGTARIGQTLFDMEPGQPKTLRLSGLGKKIVVGGVLLGSMQAVLLAAAGFDDEEPADFVRERNLVIPNPLSDKGYVTIPMPLGFHVLPNLGRIPTEFVLGGFKNPAEHVIRVMGLFADTFNPIGNAGLSMQTLAPTVLDPIAALAENKDFSGRKIAKESFDQVTPGHALARDTATVPAKWLAEGINWLSGGTAHTRGAFSPTPDQIDYLIGQATGGVGRELSKFQQSVVGAAQGDDVPWHKVPALGRFYGDAGSDSAKQSAYYRHLEAVQRHAAEVKGLRLEKKTGEAQAYLQKHPEARWHLAANAAQRNIRELQKQRRELEQQGAPREQVRALEQRIIARMERFSALVKG